MLTENVLYNIVVAWAEETLDTTDEFAHVKVIRAGQDMPRPNSANEDGSSLFITVDLVNDTALPGEPIYCETGVDEECIERLRQVLREVSFSISSYRTNAYDAARLLQTHLEGEREAELFFQPHGLSMNRYDNIARLRDIIHDQWEHRCQFTVYFRYVDVTVERISRMAAPCCGDEELDCTEVEAAC